jgi:YfiH family protein
VDLLASQLLCRVPRVEHGFGTRTSAFEQDGFASLRQIHSARWIAACTPGPAGEGDALITNVPSLGVSIRTADCLPILLADPVKCAVAAVHAGWRGTAARIVAETIGAMQRQYGTRPEDLMVAIGPGIGACCYRVGEDVGRRFGLNGPGFVDLAKENRRQLVETGVPEPQIDVLGFCTFCDGRRFHSFRRDGERAGRMISFIRML